jgi:hypothetical protein
MGQGLGEPQAAGHPSRAGEILAHIRHCRRDLALTIRRPRHDVRNDGSGPYAVFFCDLCDKEHRSSPVVPASANSRSDELYTTIMRPDQVDTAWSQVERHFNECPTCERSVCRSDWDATSGYCKECTPRREELARAEAEKIAGVFKGFASAFGLDRAAKSFMESAQQQQQQAAQAGDQSQQAGAAAPAATPTAAPTPDSAVPANCPKCGVPVTGKFCAECGTKYEPPAPPKCPQCGFEAKGAKFCPECGTKMP